MIYILENQHLQVKVSSLGAELQSIRRLDDNTEYLWQGDATYWARRASNLFPVCGRLAGGCYIYEGKKYEMGSHGFARGMEWSLLRQKTDTLTLQLTPTEETLAQYPFRFVLEMTYALEDNRLSVVTIVRNEGDAMMPFAVGGHPGFNVPLSEGECFEDYTLTFDNPCQPEWLDTTPDNCFFTGKVKELPLENGQRLPLRHTLFDGDAIFLRNADRGITLSGGGHSVHLSYPDSPYLGLWHAPRTEAPYVCMEPWVGSPAPLGDPEVLTEKADMIHLEPGECYRNTYTLTFG